MCMLGHPKGDGLFRAVKIHVIQEAFLDDILVTLQVKHWDNWLNLLVTVSTCQIREQNSLPFLP